MSDDPLPQSLHGIRGYYWGVVVKAISNEMGEAKWRDTHRLVVRLPIHTWLKFEFLPAGDSPAGPDDEENYYSTKFSEMSLGDLRSYVKRVLIWASMVGIDVPLPTTEEPVWESKNIENAEEPRGA